MTNWNAKQAMMQAMTQAMTNTNTKQAEIQAKYETYQQVVRRMKSIITALENGDISELIEYASVDTKKFEALYLRAIQAKMEWQDAAMDARTQN